MAEAICTAGAVTSTVHDQRAGLPSTLPCESNALTSKVWLPSGRFPNAWGEAHGLKSPPSRRHWNIEPGRGEPNSKFALRELASGGGAAWISVSGAFTSGSHCAVRIVRPHAISEPASFS